MRLSSAALTGLQVVREVTRAGTLEEEVVAHFDSLREPLLRYLLSFGLSLPDSEEVVQEVFLALFQHLRRDGSRANLRGWIFRVGHNLGLRRRSRSLRGADDGTTGQNASDGLPDPAPDPEEQFLRSESHRRMQAVLQALPEQDRRCLVLRAEGVRYREIAGILDMSLGAVSISLARSLARIARAADR
jgi:RNA polymerase sigma-70 factor (ECF subfamily)